MHEDACIHEDEDECMQMHERMRTLLECSQDTVYLRPDHCCYRSRAIRMETDMET